MFKRILSALSVVVISLPLALAPSVSANGTIAPFPKHTFFNNAGAPCVGCKLFTYSAGTSTKLATYSEVTLTTANANPIILDSAGRATIYLSAVSYKFVLAPSTDTDPPASPIWTQDNVGAVPATSIDTAIAGTNLLADPTFLIWPAGDSSSPAHWAAGGAGVAVARTGTGLADTNRKVGPFAAKITGGGAAVGTLLQNLLPTASYDDAMNGRSVSMGAWVRCTNASAGRLQILDGATTSTSAYHPGGSTFEWLTLTHTISSSATRLQAGLEVAATRACHISGPTFVIGQIPPSGYLPAPIINSEYSFFFPGALTTGVNKVGAWQLFTRPTLIRAAWIVVQTTPPTGAAILIDINHYDGAAAQSMFSTRPTLGISDTDGTRQAPDGTYRYRCFAAYQDNFTDSRLTVDVDQVGSVAPGTDIYLFVQTLQYARPLEAILGYSDFN